MRVVLLREEGLTEALLGLSLSYNCPTDHDMLKVAHKLANKDHGHNKFLESIVLWLDITAPREWWQQFDTYRVGVTRQSASTMHTLTKRLLTAEDFAEGVDSRSIAILNEYIAHKDWRGAKRNLPEGFLQRRIVCTSYKALRNIVRQRIDHRLSEWAVFCDEMLGQVKYPEWVIAEGLDAARIH